MEIDNEVLEKYSAIIGLQDDDQVLCCSRVTNLHKHKKVKGIIIATNSCFFVLERTRALAKKAEIVGQFFWNNVNSIELLDNTTVQFTTQTGIYKIHHRATKYFMTIIFSHIKSILAPNEMPSFIRCADILSQTSPGKDAFINRLKFLLKRTNQSCPASLMTRLQKLVEKVGTLDMPRIPGLEKYTELLLNCLEVEPSITEVVIPKGEKSTNWVILANCLRTNTTLVKVKTNDPITADVMRVADALSSNADKTKLCGISFVNSALTKASFPEITSLLQAVPFQEIQFDKTCDPETFNALFESREVAAALSSLSLLNVRLIKQVKIKETVMVLPKLRKLEIIGGAVNLAHVFEMLEECSNKFESIRINGGFLVKPVKTTALPASLYDIKFCHVEWGGLAFLSVWQLVMSHHPENKKLSAAFSSANLTEKRWETFLSRIPSTPCADLVSFAWDENPPDARILKVLLKSPNLTQVSFDGCLSNGSESVSYFADFLNASKTVTDVSIRGTEKARLGASAEVLFRKLAKNKVLKVFDVSGNDFQDKGLAAFGELLVANKVLERVSFRDNNIQTGKAFESFFTSVMNRGPKLNLEWPEKELHALRKAKAVKASAIHQMMDCYAIIKNGNLKIEADPSAELEGDEDNVFAGWDEEGDSDQEVSEPIPLARNPSSDGLVRSNAAFEDNKWKLTVPPVAIPNIDAQVAAMQRTYTMDVLLQRLKNI